MLQAFFSPEIGAAKCTGLLCVMDEKSVSGFSALRHAFDFLASAPPSIKVIVRITSEVKP